MPVFLFALALMAADTPAPEAVAPVPAAAVPRGAPSDDYGLVAWCYGALGGYLDLYDEVMPEVTRIESTFRKPGTRLEDDLKVYADLRAESRANLQLFARAISAAEKASLRPISERGAEAVRRGRSAWTAAATISKARVAQEWMSWSLPGVCLSTAERLEARATLLGATFDPAEGAAPAETPPAEPGLEAAPARETAQDTAQDTGETAAPTIDSLLAGAGAPASEPSGGEVEAAPEP